MDLIDTDRAVELYQALGSAVEMSGGSAANTMCGVASFGGPRGLHRQGQRRRARARCSATTCSRSACSSGPAPTTTRCPTGRCIIVVTPDAERTMNTYLGASSLLGDQRRRRRRGGRRPRALHGGLPVRPTGGQAGVPARRSHRPRRRADGLAHAVRFVLRRPSPRRLPVARRRRGRSAVRQRGRADGAVPDRDLRRLDRGAAQAVPAGGDHDRRQGIDRRHRRRADRRARRFRFGAWSTPPAPATSTPPASCTGSRRARHSPRRDIWARSPPPRSSATSVPGPLSSCVRCSE